MKPKRKILCIEDDIRMAQVIELSLKRYDFEFNHAINGAEGLDLLSSWKPDLILLDLMMPDMSGWDVYERMRKNDETKDVPVIVVTAKAAPFDKVLGLSIAKVDGYVTKPFTRDELISTINSVLENRAKSTS